MSSQPIGIFDSGVGGLTVFKAVAQAMPHEDLIYLGDTARVPYGPKSADTVARYAQECAAFLLRQNVKLIVVACNSASAVALKALSQIDVPVLTVIGPGARRAIQATRSGRIAVIGTRATINSGAYADALKRHHSGELPPLSLQSVACPLFVPLAEEGWVDDSISRQVAERYLTDLKQADVDTMVLGCTHYPLLKSVIGAVMGPEVTLVDSAEAVAAEVRGRLDREGVAAAPKEREGQHRFFVTDNPAPFQAVAERFLGRRDLVLEQVRIETVESPQ